MGTKFTTRDWAWCTAIVGTAGMTAVICGSLGYAMGAWQEREKARALWVEIDRQAFERGEKQGEEDRAKLVRAREESRQFAFQVGYAEAERSLGKLGLMKAGKFHEIKVADRATRNIPEYMRDSDTMKRFAIPEILWINENAKKAESEALSIDIAKLQSLPMQTRVVEGAAPQNAHSSVVAHGESKYIVFLWQTDQDRKEGAVVTFLLKAEPDRNSAE